MPEEQKTKSDCDSEEKAASSPAQPDHLLEPSSQSQKRRKKPKKSKNVPQQQEQQGAWQSQQETSPSTPVPPQTLTICRNKYVLSWPFSVLHSLHTWSLSR